MQQQTTRGWFRPQFPHMHFPNTYQHAQMYKQDGRDRVFDEGRVGRDMLDFLYEFYRAHPEVAENPFYVTGESYAVRPGAHVDPGGGGPGWRVPLRPCATLEPEA